MPHLNTLITLLLRFDPSLAGARILPLYLHHAIALELDLYVEDSGAYPNLVPSVHPQWRLGLQCSPANTHTEIQCRVSCVVMASM